MELPQKFIDSIKELLGEESEAFLRALTEEEPPVCVRINVRKPGVVFEGAHRVKWNEHAFYLGKRPEFIFDPLFHAGAYYVQEASSTIYEPLVKRLLPEISNNAPRVLDLCAAPGGKTTAMINALPDGSEVHANEYVAKRADILRENLSKWGYPEVKVTNYDSKYFALAGETFDIVAVDAPCSGEGMMRKDDFAREQWSETLVEKCSLLQREILDNAVNAVKPGGFLIYSTCTFNRRENEENAEYLKDRLGLEPFDPGFPKEWSISKGIDTDLPVGRFMPHKVKGEGLFFAVFKKPKAYTELNLDNSDFEDKSLEINHSGERYGKVNGRCRLEKAANKAKSENKIKEKDKNRSSRTIDRKRKEETTEELSIEKILSIGFDTTHYPSVDLEKAEAIKYLRGESLILDASLPKGIIIVKYHGFPLGAVKNIGMRANNLYPKPWRIKKQS